MKKLFITLTLLFTTLSANAAGNTLQTVQIDSIKDTYNIILTSDEKPEFKKTIQASNRMVIDLKDVRASKTVNTIYNNATNVDTVMIEPVGDSDLKILIQADNVSEAAITFDTLSTPYAAPQATDSNTTVIPLSKPITEYTPIYSDEETEEVSSNALIASPLIASAKNSVKSVLEPILENDNAMNIVTWGLLAIVVLGGIRLFKKDDNEIKVGLSQSMKDRELSLYRGMAGVTPQSEAVSNYAASNLNYALKSYQNNTKSPYMTNEVARRYPAQPQVAQRPSLPVQPTLNTTKTLTKPVVSSPLKPSAQQSNLTKPALKASNIDSMKFLESMTKIYEKNGRSDLAQNLKSNMSKAKSKI